MSTSRQHGRVTCVNDCNSMGCPGHNVTIEHHNTSDTITILVDEKKLVILDDNLLDLICELYQQYKTNDL